MLLFCVFLIAGCRYRGACTEYGLYPILRRLPFGDTGINRGRCVRPRLPVISLAEVPSPWAPPASTYTPVVILLQLPLCGKPPCTQVGGVAIDDRARSATAVLSSSSIAGVVGGRWPCMRLTGHCRLGDPTDGDRVIGLCPSASSGRLDREDRADAGDGGLLALLGACAGALCAVLLWYASTRPRPRRWSGLAAGCCCWRQAAWLLCCVGVCAGAGLPPAAHPVAAGKGFGDVQGFAACMLWRWRCSMAVI